MCCVLWQSESLWQCPSLASAKKLENLGFIDHILHWVSGYLASNSQSLVANGESSLPTPVISGVPQGSVICPLFLIHINDLTEINLRDSAKIILYAADVLLFRVINSPEDFANLQDGIHKVGNWSCTYHLTLHQDKCKYMIVHTWNCIYHFCLKAILGNRWKCSSIWVFSYHMISLGVNMFNQFAVRKILGLLYRRFYNNAPGSAILQLYISLVRLHLDYASAIWSPYLSKDKTKLENVQKFACYWTMRQQLPRSPRTCWPSNTWMPKAGKLGSVYCTRSSTKRVTLIPHSLMQRRK